MSGHETTATINGRTYTIPDMWLATFCRELGYTVPQALAWWDWQARMDESGKWTEAPKELTC